ncbi:hypothetical protein SUNI508_01822 [Seiridium unicorne]|uniref:Uncharacterized protein n=1 Tax=Seiridium unicorne TaxID=138068 RepID=A0ABR2UP50_9PEZI
MVETDKSTGKVEESSHDIEESTEELPENDEGYGEDSGDDAVAGKEHGGSETQYEHDGKEEDGGAEEAGSDQDGEEEQSNQDEVDEQKGAKREPTPNSQSGSLKKQRTSKFFNIDTSEPNGAAAEGKVGTKHDEPRDPKSRGSANRLPKKG